MWFNAPDKTATLLQHSDNECTSAASSWVPSASVTYTHLYIYIYMYVTGCHMGSVVFLSGRQHPSDDSLHFLSDFGLWGKNNSDKQQKQNKRIKTAEEEGSEENSKQLSRRVTCWLQRLMIRGCYQLFGTGWDLLHVWLNRLLLYVACRRRLNLNNSMVLWLNGSQICYAGMGAIFDILIVPLVRSCMYCVFFL